MDHGPIPMPGESLDTTTYLHRLGMAQRPAPTLATLRELQLRHTGAIAFETLSPLLHAPVPIDLASLQRKVLHDGRGGYCYELNLLFLALLRELGFDARGLTGRVVMGGPEDAMTARTHMLVLVTLDGVRHVTDVGFGGMVPTAPLLLDSQDAQPTPHEPYRLEQRDGHYLLRARVAGQWRPLYVFDLQPQAQVDYDVGNWYVSTHPDSVFLGQLVAARTGEGWRKTLRNGDFAVHRTGADTQRKRLVDADAVVAALGAEFGIRVPRHPQLHGVIERLLREARER
jgi:N-hydroxyarylamine O-acetyltransferase